MKKEGIVIIGNFNFDNESFNGQTRKTRDYYYYLGKHFGESNLSYVDTVNFRKSPLRSLSLIKKMAKKNHHIVLLLGINAGSIIIPYINLLKKRYKFKLYWPVVGGSILYDKKKEKKVIKYFNKIEAIYFETKEMTEFYSKEFNNVFYAPVFTSRKLNNNINTIESDIIKFCTYSRVSKEKGISRAIEAIKQINNSLHEHVCTLDIIGEPSTEYEIEFNTLLVGTEKYIFRKPYLYGDDVLEKISCYDAMIFPTFYEGEGFPIAVVECFLAGVPVVASNWHFNSEIIEHEKTGLIFELDDKHALTNQIKRLINDKELMDKLKIGAKQESEKFKPEKVLEHLINRIERNMK